MRGHRVLASGEGRWEPPAPEATFTYVRLHFDDIPDNVRSADEAAEPQTVPQP